MGPSRVSAAASRLAALAGAAPLDQAAERDRRLGRQRQRPRVDQRQHALAREHEAGAGEPQKMGEGGDRDVHHSFQPECSATTPPVMGVNETRRKPAASIIAAKRLRLGKLADRFDQILIGLAVAGDRVADAPG